MHLFMFSLFRIQLHELLTFENCYNIFDSYRYINMIKIAGKISGVCIKKPYHVKSIVLYYIFKKKIRKNHKQSLVHIFYCLLQFTVLKVKKEMLVVLTVRLTTSNKQKEQQPVQHVKGTLLPMMHMMHVVKVSLIIKCILMRLSMVSINFQRNIEKLINFHLNLLLFH